MSSRGNIAGADGPDPRRGVAGPMPGDRLVRTMALATGAAFLVVGVLGFVPGITTDYDQLEFAGHESGAQLLGVFQVSVLHNIVHLLFGVAGLALWVYGLAIDHHGDANFVPLNSADNWLHLVLGVAMIGMGVAGHRALRGGIGSQSPM